jgi:SAM-dependent methyltransferase
VAVQQMDLDSPEDLGGLEQCFDTVLCLNVLEYLQDPDRVLDSLRATLKPGGALIVLVPQSPSLFGSLDRSLGHKRRYSASAAREQLEAHGFSIEKVYSFNKAGAPPWWAYSRMAGSRRIGKLVLKIFDKTVFFWSRVDRLLPWKGLSLILVARNQAQLPHSQAPWTLDQQTPASST